MLVVIHRLPTKISDLLLGSTSDLTLDSLFFLHLEHPFSLLFFFFLTISLIDLLLESLSYSLLIILLFLDENRFFISALENSASLL
jgi:hypothetical protein